MARPLRIGVLAGESSGDILGAGLMQALREQRPDVEFTGMGGPLMIAQGLASLYPMDRLSVMGLIEPLKRLPELLRIRRHLFRHMLASKVDLFVGIDSPDFNLALEQQLHQAGIRTVHYVSPSVWAWRQRRIHKIAQSVDLVLTLFPFETDFYRQHAIPVKFTGHPLADQIPLQPDRITARRTLALDPDAPVLALLPGSRAGEVGRLAPPFLATAQALMAAIPTLQVLVPAANIERLQQLRTLLPAGSRIRLLEGQSRVLMEAADAVLLASGTATLEAMLYKLPMLVCYRMAPLSYAIISRLLKVPYFSLPNLLAREKVVEELVQDQVSPEILVPLMLQLLQDTEGRAQLQARYLEIHHTLKQEGSKRASDALLALL